MVNKSELDKIIYASLKSEDYLDSLCRSHNRSNNIHQAPTTTCFLKVEHVAVEIESTLPNPIMGMTVSMNLVGESTLWNPMMGVLEKEFSNFNLPCLSRKWTSVWSVQLCDTGRNTSCGVRLPDGHHPSGHAGPGAVLQTLKPTWPTWF